MRPVAAGLVAAAGSLSLLAPVDGQEQRPPNAHLGAVDAYLAERIEATDTPGMAYAVVTQESVEHVGTMGHDGTGDPVTSSTPFLWGSVSKPVTASAVMTLVESGAIGLDDPVRAHLPSFTLAGPRATDQITVRHLLEHTSGIPDGTGITDRFDRVPDPYGDALAELAAVAPATQPGAAHEYASANYLVLGALVEEVTDRRFTEYLREHILEPLDMDDAITTPGEAETALADGHGYAFGRPVGVPLSYDPAGPSYGYLGGSVEDLTHFAMAQLNGGRYGGAQLLDAATTETMWTGGARISDTHRYGLGWRDDDRNADLGTRTIWHGGAVQGYHAMIVLLPDLDLGVVVLQNSYGYFQDADLAAAGLGAARILAGGDATTPPDDPTYLLVLSALVAVLAAVVAAIAWSLHRVRRPSRGERRAPVLVRTACWVAASLILAWLAGLAVPSAVGADLRLIPLWAPDVGWLLIAIVTAALALAGVRILDALVRLWRRPVV